MSWEYLGRETDYRILPIAGFLQDKVSGKTILDLDCLEARTVHYIPNTYERYIGNDLIDRFPHGERRLFYKVSDTEISHYLTKVDILLVLGHGGWELSPSDKESPNLTAATLQIINKYRPDIVVLESCQDYSECIKHIARSIYYDIEFHMRVTPVPRRKEFYYKREIICLTRP